MYMDMKDVEEMFNSLEKMNNTKKAWIVVSFMLFGLLFLIVLAATDSLFFQIISILVLISLYAVWHDIGEYRELKEKIEVQKRMSGDEKTTIIIENKTGIGWFWKLLIFIIAFPIIVNIIFGISIASLFF